MNQIDWERIINLGTIATSLMIIAATYLIWVSSKTTKKSSKKK